MRNLVLFILLLFPVSSFAEVKVDSMANASNLNGTIPITVANHTNRVLVVLVNYFSDGGPATSLNVTYNGTMLTRAINQTNAPGWGYYADASIWYLLNPEVGTHNVVVAPANARYDNGVISLYEVNQSAPAVTAAFSNNSGTTVATNLTSDGSGCVITVMGNNNPYTSEFTPSGSPTEIFKNGPLLWGRGYGYYTMHTAAGDQWLNGTYNDTTAWRAVKAEFKPGLVNLKRVIE